jgi:hypothetical protein
MPSFDVDRSCRDGATFLLLPPPSLCETLLPADTGRKGNKDL